MFSFPWWLLFLFLFITLNSDPVFSDVVCSTLCNRRDWVKLNDTEKVTYASAVVDFYQKDPEGYRALVKVHDDFGDAGIHNSLHFLGWHRYYLMVYQRLLRKYQPKLCLPYWDVSAQSQTFALSPVFNVTHGFGALTRDCVIFGKLDSNGILDSKKKCLTRDPTMTQNPDMPLVIDGKLVVDKLLEETSFSNFSSKLEGGYHSQVHTAVAGHMATYNSPLDPVFFLHHCKIDQLWAEWQSRNFPVRLREISTTPTRPLIESLDSVLIGYPDLRISDVMDITNLCYFYEGVAINPRVNTPTENSVSSNPTPKVSKGNYLVLQGLPPGKGINLAMVDSARLEALKKMSKASIVNNLPFLTSILIDVPPPPPRPSWCMVIPGLPDGKCMKRSNTEDFSFWENASFSAVESLWFEEANRIVDIPTTNTVLRRRASSGGKLVDLGEICYLKHSTPVSDAWIKMIGFNLNYVRNLERENALLVDKLNALPGLIPTSATVNDVQAIAKILDQAGSGIDTVVCTARGKKYEFPFTKDSLTTAQLISESVKKSIVTPQSTIKELTNIVGVSAIGQGVSK